MLTFSNSPNSLKVLTIFTWAGVELLLGGLSSYLEEDAENVEKFGMGISRYTVKNFQGSKSDSCWGKIVNFWGSFNMSAVVTWLYKLRGRAFLSAVEKKNHRMTSLSGGSEQLEKLWRCRQMCQRCDHRVISLWMIFCRVCYRLIFSIFAKCHKRLQLNDVDVEMMYDSTSSGSCL